jgi:uncharacterized membrane protein YfcA
MTIEFGWMVVIALGAVALAGIVRGLTGFGAAMIIVTSLSAIYDPISAVIILTIIDIPGVIPLAPSIYRHARWNVVLLLFVAALPAIPLGVWLLSVADEVVMRRLIASSVLLFALLSAAGWELKQTPNLAAKLSIGAMSGCLSGAAGLGGPPIILYFLSQKLPKEVLRACALVFLLLSGLVAVVFYYARGLISIQHLEFFLIGAPIYITSMWAGARIFKSVSESTFRKIVIGLVCAIALVSFLK